LGLLPPQVLHPGRDGFTYAKSCDVSPMSFGQDRIKVRRKILCTGTAARMTNPDGESPHTALVFTHMFKSDHLYIGCTDGRNRPAP
jgi:hypothetical protein